MKHIFLIFISILFISDIYATNNILEGKVVDSNGQNIPLATVKLFFNDSSFIQGVKTDSIGIYKFSNINNGDYLIKFSCIGFTNKDTIIAIKQNKTVLPTVTLQSNINNINEIYVVGSNTVRLADRTIIQPLSEHKKHSQNGYDLLYNMMIPGLNIDKSTGKISNYGCNVTLFIDGIEADFREVRNLSPHEIKKVEYIDVPNGKYIGEEIVINFVTFKSGGYLSFDGANKMGYLNYDYNFATKLVKEGTNYNVFAGLSAQEHDKNNNYSNEIFYFPDYNLHRQKESKNEETRKNDQYFQFAASSNNKRRILKAKLILEHSALKNKTNSLLNYSEHYNILDSSQTIIEKDASKISLNLNSEFKISSKQNIKMTLNNSYTTNEYLRTYEENSNTTLMDTKENLYELSANINYIIQLKKRSSIAFQLHHFHKVSSVTYAGEKRLWQHLWTGESILLALYKQQIGNSTTLTFRPGVSSLQYKLHGENRITQFSPRLNFVINHNISKKQYAQIRFALANSFPNIQMLNNAEQEIDFVQTRRGNPNLKNTSLYATTGVYAINFNKFSMQAVSMYFYYKNYILESYTIENNKLIRGYSSDANLHHLYASLSTTWKPIKNFHFNVSGEYNNIYCTSNIEALVIKAQLNYYIKDFKFCLYANSSSKGWNNNTIVKTPATYGLNGSWNRDNWNLEIGTDNPFLKKRIWKQNLNTELYKWSNNYSNRIYNFTGYIKFKYTFNFRKRIKHETIDKKSTINSAILKMD